MRRVALIGRPLRRRHSQVMHDAAFAAAGIDARYELRELGPEQLSDFVTEARGESWYGFQITAPYKTTVMQWLDEVDPQAAAIGAVNSVHRREDGTLVGFNTDAPGFAAAVARDLDVDLRAARVVLIGAGGAARAVARAVVDGEAQEMMIAARRPEQAKSLRDAMKSGQTTMSVQVLGSTCVDQALGVADLVVNATTVGMLQSGSVVDARAFGADTAIFDLVYVPSETELIVAARSRGLRATNGTEMLVAQAAIAFQRWTGVPGVEDVMRRAVAPLLTVGSEP